MAIARTVDRKAEAAIIRLNHSGRQQDQFVGIACQEREIIHCLAVDESAELAGFGFDRRGLSPVYL